MDSDERRARIVRQVADAGFVRVTDLAREFGISRATAWRDIDKLAKAGAVVKVHGGAAGLKAQSGVRGSVPDADLRTGDDAGTAATPVPGGRGQLTLGMQVPSTSYYYRAVIDGAREAAATFGARLAVGVSGYASLEADLDSIRSLVGLGVAGLLVTPIQRPQQSQHRAEESQYGGTRAMLAEFEVPAVLVERELLGLVGSASASVVTASDAGVFAAMEHLRGLGHRRIGFITAGQGSRTHARMVAGYRDGIVQLGVELPPTAGAWEWHGPGDRAVPIEDVITEVRAAGVTAVVVFNDPLAGRIAHEAPRLGVQIPRDLSIISYDDEIAADAIPPLTAVSPQRHAVGYTAARMLLTHLAGGERLGGRRVQVEPELVVRESTASAPGQLGESDVDKACGD